MKNEHLVSIITPSFNCSKSIAKTIDSVLGQSYQNWEMLIADDCSGDATCEVIQQYVDMDTRIKLIKREWNAGPAVTRNRAIQAAKGRFIAFLDADDTWHKDKLEKQIKFMLDRQVTLSYTGYERIHEDGRKLGTMTVPSSVCYHDILKTNSIGCLTACYDSLQLGKVYMPNIAKRQDLALWLRILKKTDRAYGIQESLADYYVGVSSVSANKVIAAKYQWRVYREIEKLGLIQSLYYFFSYAFQAVKNRL
ncbi:glycosyltransferase family 2 protein [Shewanella sp. Scap07]|uniref:glycosyltransferase family 2 protein n=1 Tax=Shewanella sp. Scap07 TaxID=2589987 RepID=UPI0015BA8FF9|nr:glycosyltransferase family 2 protein [Shewanella sp. Scap07]QLE86117.1 glycosyltransferase family 2 protein [Shewanella sp. Scap07]